MNLEELPYFFQREVKASKDLEIGSLYPSFNCRSYRSGKYFNEVTV
jgi:hypothetical protein